MLFSALLLGLMGSLHCVGMCGPIAFLLPVDRTNNLKKFGQILSYHCGRLLAYAIIGLVFGLLGKGLHVFGMQQKLSIFIGILMIALVLLPAKLWNTSQLARPLYSWISALKNRLGRELKSKSADTFLTIGVLNGFLPCGLVYMALFGAIAMGNAIQGSMYMVLFGTGTIPLMTAIVYFRGFFSGSVRRKAVKLVPVFVILVGALFILRGLGLDIPFVSPAPVSMITSNALECIP